MICAHEVAHLWFGCLVGPRWWDDVWLDEAIATYLSYAALAAIAGVSESLSWTGFAYTDKPRAYEADELPSRQPVSSPVSTATQGRDKPYGILYVKGASVIRSLAALIGDDALRRGLSDYLSRFAFSSATLDDLVGCWSRASGQDLAGWAEQWLRAEGTTTIRLDGDDAVVQDVPRRQRIGIGLYDLDGDGQLHRRSLLHAELDAERTVVAGLTSADAVVLNDQDLSYTRTGFDARSRGCSPRPPARWATRSARRCAGTGSGCWSPAASCRPRSSRTWYAGVCRQAACPRWASRRCSAAPSRPPTRGLRRASERACGNRSPTRHGPRPETRASSRSASPPARRLTISSPCSAHGWPERTCRTGSPSTPSCGRGSCSRSRLAGWRARRTSTRCRGSTPSPAR